MSNYILFDNQDNYDFLKPNFDGVFYSPKCKNKIVSWIKGACIALRNTKKNDLIVCWFDFQAVLLFWMSLIFMRRRKIVCLNILLKDKKTFRNRIVSLLYKVALSSKNFRATTTSNEYGLLLNKKFGRNYKYVLLRDVYRSYYEFSSCKIISSQKSVFCGGRNGRDWNLFFKIAARMPEINFKAVVPSEIKKTYAAEMHLSNVLIRENIPYEEFLQEMCSSEIVIMPLDTDAPAGLIVMFQAAANEKNLIVSDTPVTREYVIDGCGYRVENDVEKWIAQIRFCLKNKEDARACASRLKKYLINECSEKKFIETIRGIYD